MRNESELRRMELEIHGFIEAHESQNAHQHPQMSSVHVQHLQQLQEDLRQAHESLVHNEVNTIVSVAFCGSRHGSC